MSENTEKETIEISIEATSPEEFPKHIGGGYFLLSNGEKVRMKRSAQIRQDEIWAEAFGETEEQEEAEEIAEQYNVEVQESKPTEEQHRNVISTVTNNENHMSPPVTTTRERRRRRLLGYG